ncbi:EpsG family protein [Mucilaginibacter sp. KACC 22063]|uniref:EpsG family protein n=1 Tax=Mucilaginibacter sp. KACC 22063 TaxID=3025666 RepID=UPI0023660B62|nr:EpsG family protein [Mucilaginibacter sp. KACC 22063]WDF54712.1 EpsG family protein [Mucilaginibacter sp. KACC 22063]
MILYYLFFLFFGFSASLDFVKQDDYKLQLIRKNIFIIGFFFILIFVGFRYKIGSDWLSYLRMYDEAFSLTKLFQNGNLDFSTDFTEPGFKILVSLCKGIGINYSFFVFIITVFNTASLFYFIKHNQFSNKLVFLALILILTTFLEFDILRQSIAFHIVLFAFSDGKLKLRKLLPFTALALTFHFTAVIFIIFYLFQKLNLSFKGILVLVILYFISLFITIPIITFGLKALEPIVGGTLTAVLSKAVTLVEGFNFKRSVSFTSILNFIFLVLLAMRIRTIKLTSSEQLLIKLFLFYIVINILFKEVQEVADRFSYYFNFGIAFMFCLLDRLILIRERKLVLLIVPSLFILMRLTLHFKDPGIRYGQTPYRNYFFIEKSDEAEIMERYDMMQSIKSSEYDYKKD